MVDVVLFLVAYIKCNGTVSHQFIDITRRYFNSPFTCGIGELLEFFCVSHANLSDYIEEGIVGTPGAPAPPSAAQRRALISSATATSAETIAKPFCKSEPDSLAATRRPAIMPASAPPEKGSAIVHCK